MNSGNEQGMRDLGQANAPKKLTLSDIQKMVRRDERPITMITCYDYSMAHLVERAGVDILLVGDSLGMTMLGHETTLNVTMDDMVRHGAAVRRGAPNRFVIVDMPYMSYQPSNALAVSNAGRLMAETGCDAVKLEGGSVSMVDRIRAVVEAGIPVMGHLGLTPQSASALGGFRVQGKKAGAAERILDEARRVEEAGASSLLLELVPDRLCQLVREQAKIPIIGLGAGAQADGQLLIFHDLFGLYPDFKPRMAKQYGDAASLIRSGLARYVDDVRARTFPDAEHSFTMSDEAFELVNGVNAQKKR